MPNDTTDPAIIKLENVRLSFPHLFTAHAMEEGQEPKFSATFIMDNTTHGALLDKIEATIERLALDEFKKKTAFKSCLHDGNEKPDMDGYGDGVMYLTSACKTRPPVVDRVLTPIVEEDGKIYAGCYVNATVRLWIQNNKWGKRCNAALRAVQFVRDGESFGAGPVDAEREFDTIDEQVGEKGRSKQRSPGKAGKANLDEF